MIIIRLVLLLFLLLFIKYYPKLTNYSLDTKFNFYRSLICLYLSINSLDIIINNIFSFNKITSYNNNEINDHISWFKSYIILDLLYMIYNKNNRIDLYIHHIFCLINFIIIEHYNNYSLLYSLMLLNECISIVSGIDSMYLEDKNYEKSKKYKKIRINIIKYIRRPVWIISIFLLLYNKNNMIFNIFLINLVGCILFLFLDIYWENKCYKIINKNI